MDFNPNAMPTCLANGEIHAHVRLHHPFRPFLVHA